MHTELELKLPYEWSQARSVRTRVQEALADLADGVGLDGVLIVASELVENALKYGTQLAQLPEIRFHLKLDGALLRIEVTQGVRSQEALQALQDCLSSLDAHASPQELYFTRLEAIASGIANGGLGLYRVAAEGGFRLAHHLERNVLTVIAERRLEEASP